MKKKFLNKIIAFILVLISFTTGAGCAEHTHNYKKSVIHPTCEIGGYTIYICNCGSRYKDDSTNALGHNFINYISNNDATKEQDGTKTAKCSRVGCNKINTVTDVGSKLVETFNVKLVYNNGKVDSAYKVQKGTTFKTPADPSKTNYIFKGWYQDKLLVNKYDFSQAVTKDITIYAGYEIDAAKITNEISTNIIKGLVKIYNKSYNTVSGRESSSISVQGSGFCFHIQNGYYYILTNCHVAKKESGYDNQKFIIEDYQGNQYDGYLYKNPNKSVRAISPDYDLACLYFKSNKETVQRFSFAQSNPNVEDDIILLGAPDGQNNAITFGKVINYKKIVLNTDISESNVKFDVIQSNAYTNGGSSGGPAINSSFEVVGVHYAGSANKEQYQFSYEVPIEKVIEFLREYVYN